MNYFSDLRKILITYKKAHSELRMLQLQITKGKTILSSLFKTVLLEVGGE